MDNLTIEEAKAEEFDNVRKFYVNVNYGGIIDPTCNVIVAKSKEEIIGVGRVCKENDVLVLRGMEILPEFQRQGLGTKILDKIKVILENRECFVLPYDYLEKFYGQIGFKKINNKEAPKFLQDRIIEYKNKDEYPNSIIMKKST